MSKKENFIVPIVALITCVSALVACGKRKEDGQGVYTYRLSSLSSPSTWNVHTWQTSTDKVIMDYTELGLYDFIMNSAKDGYEIVPEMAATLANDVTSSLSDEEKEQYSLDNSTRGIKWIIDLNQHATWADGTAINADTYIYSMEKMLSPLMKNYRASSYYAGTLSLANAEAYYKQGSVNYGYNDMVGGQSSTSVDGKLYFSLYEKVQALDDADGKFSLFYYYDKYSSYADEDFPLLKALVEDTNRFGTSKAPKAVEVTAANRPEIFAAVNQFMTNLFDSPVVDSMDITQKDAIANYFLVKLGGWATMDFNQVGIKKTGDYQLTLYLGKEISEFDFYYNLASNWIVHQPLYEAGMTQIGSLYATTYGTSLNTYMSYGPYKLTNYQLDKQILMAKNDAWYGYRDGKHENQFQCTNIDIQIIPSQSTELLMFESGKLDEVGLLGADMNKYRFSSRVMYTPESYTSKVTLNSSFSSLKARQKDGQNKTVLANQKFREAISWSLNRRDFVQTLTAGSGAALTPINDSYISDVDTGSIYRNTSYGQGVVEAVYGDKNSSGYDITKAIALFNQAYEEEIASSEAGSLKPTDKVFLEWEIYNEDWSDYIDYYVDCMKAALNQSSFAGKYEIKTIVDANCSAHMKAGTTDMCMSTYGGGELDPFGVMEVYVSADYRYEYGFDPDAHSLTMTLSDGVAQTHTFSEWYILLNATDYSAAKGSADDRLKILSEMEIYLTKTFNFVCIYSRRSVSLNSLKIEYGTETYNVVYRYGGVRFMTFNYDDAGWAKRIKKPLDYTK